MIINVFFRQSHVMRLWLLLLASLAMTSAVASADKSNDDINTKVMDHDDDDHHHGGHDGDDDDGEPRIVDRSRGGQILSGMYFTITVYTKK